MTGKTVLSVTGWESIQPFTNMSKLISEKKHQHIGKDASILNG